MGQGLSSTGAPPTKLCILVVEDDGIVREIVARRLAGAGHEVIKADDGLAAMAILEGRRVDVVLTDLNMPGIDGHEVIAMLRQGRPNVLVIVMTGEVTMASITRCMGGGAFGFVPKPTHGDLTVLDRQIGLAGEVIQEWRNRLVAVCRPPTP